MSKGVFSYLPKHFWYNGMFKIKAGKGYLNQITGETELVGVPGGPCKECEGTIISVKICTSVKGFETTTEKVCDTCGLVYPTSFQVLERIEEDYRTPYYDSHEAWKEAHKGKMQGNPEDIDAYMETKVHIDGKRSLTSDDVDYGAHDEPKFKNKYHRNLRLQQAIGRLNNVPQSKHMDKQAWRNKEYHDTADDIIHIMHLNKYHAADLHYWIDHNEVSKFPYKMEDMIYHMGLIIGKKDLRKYKECNRRLYDLLMERYHR